MQQGNLNVSQELGGVPDGFNGDDPRKPLKEGEGAELTPRLLASCFFQLPMGMIWSTIGNISEDLYISKVIAYCYTMIVLVLVCSRMWVAPYS
jgi:hypothetical protein